MAAVTLLILAIAGTACADANGTIQVADVQAAGRLAPPQTLQCDRNELTSYSGTVTGYDRSVEQTRIEITTDWGSVESFTLPHADGRVEQRFLLWGEPFQATDWSQIENRPGQLIEGTLAIVWVCEDPAVAPVVDWRPRNQE